MRCTLVFSSSRLQFIIINWYATAEIYGVIELKFVQYEAVVLALVSVIDQEVVKIQLFYSRVSYFTEALCCYDEPRRIGVFDTLAFWVLNNVSIRLSAEFIGNCDVVGYTWKYVWSYDFY